MEMNFYDCYVRITGFAVLIINVHNQFLSIQGNPTAYRLPPLWIGEISHKLLTLCYDAKLEK